MPNKYERENIYDYAGRLKAEVPKHPPVVCPLCEEPEGHKGTCVLSMMMGGPSYSWDVLRRLNPMIGGARIIIVEEIAP